MALPDTHHALTDALNALATLRRNYERYWQGLERPEPVRERDRLRQLFRTLLVDVEGPSNTALAFRVRTAQTSFRAFDELCERRNRDPSVAPLERRRETAVKPKREAQHDDTVVASRPALSPFSEKPSPFDDMYDALVQQLQKQGQAVPTRDKFVRQVESHLSRAKAAAPDKTLRAELSFDEAGRAKLIVVDATL